MCICDPAPTHPLSHIKQFHQSSLTLCTQRPDSGLSPETDRGGDRGGGGRKRCIYIHKMSNVPLGSNLVTILQTTHIKDPYQKC